MSICFRVVNFKFSVILIVVTCKISTYLIFRAVISLAGEGVLTIDNRKNPTGCHQPTQTTGNEHGHDQRGHQETLPPNLVQLGGEGSCGLVSSRDGRLSSQGVLYLPTFRNCCIFVFLTYYFTTTTFFFLIVRDRATVLAQVGGEGWEGQQLNDVCSLSLN